MKSLRCTLIVVFALTPVLANAQWHGPNIPDSLSFQGYLTDTAGVALDTTMDVTFKLYKSSTKIWEQTQTDVTISNGVFNIILGGTGTASLDTVAFNEPIDLGITIDGSELQPRTPLTGSAYALGMRGMYAVMAEKPGQQTKAPNLIGGASNNYVGDVVGATISGGGGWEATSFYADSVLGNWGTIGGGVKNTAGLLATVSGGFENRATNEGTTIAGGQKNTVTGQRSTIGGGFRNLVTGTNSTIPGGTQNSVFGDFSFAAGYRASAKHEGTFVWNDRASNSDSMVSTAANQFLVDAAGGVGFGTNLPKPGLTISRESQEAAFQLELRNVGNITQTNYDGIAFTQADSGSTVLASIKVAYHNDGRPDMSFSVRDAADALFIEANTGAVGIGTTSPSRELQVNGEITAITITETSDARLKRRVAPVVGALPKLLALQGVTFDWDTSSWPDRKFTSSRQMGLIAQDVAEVVPEVVREGDDGFYSVAYAKLVPLLIEAIKEQQTVIDQQNNRLAVLEARLTP